MTAVVRYAESVVVFVNMAVGKAEVIVVRVLVGVNLCVNKTQAVHHLPLWAVVMGSMTGAVSPVMHVDNRQNIDRLIASIDVKFGLGGMDDKEVDGTVNLDYAEEHSILSASVQILFVLSWVGR